MPGTTYRDSTGIITAPGDRTALDTDSEGEGNFSWEPTLYVVPTNQKLNSNNIYCDTKTAGCIPHFPDIIKGDYNTADNLGSSNNNNNTSGTSGGGGFTIKGGYKGPPVDDDSAFLNGLYHQGGNPNGGGDDAFYSEFIWNVDALGLQPGKGYKKN